MAKKPASKGEDTEGPVVEEIADAEVLDTTPPADEIEQKPVLPEIEEPKESRPIAGLVAVGLLALLVGGAAVYLFQPTPPDNQDQIDQLTAQIEVMSAKIDAPDETAGQTADAVVQLKTTLSDELGGIGDTIGGLVQRLAQVDARMEQLEARPETRSPEEFTGAVQALRGDLASWQKEAERLRAENASLSAELSSARAEIAAIRESLVAAEAALAQAEQSRGIEDKERLAGIIARLGNALAEGGPFVDAAQDYQAATGTSLPEGLAAASGSGVPTAVTLQAGFPDAARSALAVSLQSREGRGPLEKAGDFVRAQLGVRSVIAREGTDPDAVLSRAQAAVDAGEFGAAAAELAALPDAGQVEMQAWTEMVMARVAAENALAEVRQ